MIKLLKSYFAKAASYSTPRFVLEMTAVCFLLKILFVFIFVILFMIFGISTDSDTSYETSLVQQGILMMVPLTIFFALIETVVSQWFMIWFLSRFIKVQTLIIFLSAFLFALLHVVPLLMAAVFPIGLILAWSWILYRKRSLWSAIWVTTSIHVLHNLIVLWFVSIGS